MFLTLCEDNAISYLVFHFFSEGEEWLRMRSVLRQLIMRPRDVAVFSDDVSQVVDDLIRRIVCLRSQSTDGTTICNINDLFFKYAMEGWQTFFFFVIQSEIFHPSWWVKLFLHCTKLQTAWTRSAYSKGLVLAEPSDNNKKQLFLEHLLFFVPTGIAAILYENRLGCLEDQIPKETENYIAALHLMFSSFKMTMYAGAIPKWLRPVFPKPWQEFCDSWDGLFRFSE